MNKLKLILPVFMLLAVVSGTGFLSSAQMSEQVFAFSP